MRPTLQVLEHLTEALNTVLAHSPIEKVWRPTATSLLLDIRGLRQLIPEEGGKRPRLFIDLAPPEPWLAITTRWPETPSQPDRTTLEFRKYLEGATIALAAIEDERRFVLLCTPRGQRTHEAAPSLEFIVQFAGRYPQVGLMQEGEALTQLLPVRAIRDTDSPRLRQGPSPEVPADGAYLLAHGEAAWQQADESALQREHHQLLTHLKRSIRKQHERLADLEAQSEKAETRHTLFHEAELLKTTLHQIKPKATSVEVMDYTQDPPAPLTIALDPSLPPKEQLNRRFARYRKLTRTAEAVSTQQDQELERLLALEALEQAFQSPLPQLDSLKAQLLALAPMNMTVHTQRQREQARLPYRTFYALDGSEIWAGRSARDNDTLTFRLARGSDYFFHARDVSGSHVILCHRRRDTPHPEAILDAATLAAHLSQARHEGVVDVLYVERKHVKRVKGASPGRVQTATPKTLTVRVDEARLNRLYASQVDSLPEA